MQQQINKIKGEFSEKSGIKACNNTLTNFSNVLEHQLSLYVLNSMIIYYSILTTFN